MAAEMTGSMTTEKSPDDGDRAGGSMLRLHGLIGHWQEPHLRVRLHALEHADAVEYVVIAEADIGRRRLRLVTDKGTDCAISVDRPDELTDGAVLLLEPARAIVLRVGAPKLWRLRARDVSAAMQLGWHAGNLHWRVRFDGDALLVLLDGPLADYRARLRTLIDSKQVEDAGDA